MDLSNSGWIETRLGDILTIHYGKGLPAKTRSGAGFPVYGSNGIIGFHKDALTQSETIIIGRKGSVGEINYSSGPCFPIDTTYYVDQFYSMPAKYWYYFLKSLRLGNLNKATAIPGINRDDIYNSSISLASINEQKRIADKLSDLFGRVEVCEKHLERIPLILERFRQSVLAEAMSGRLTADRQEGDEQVRFRRVRLDEICFSITDGPHQSPPKTQSGIPFITISDISDGRLQLDRASRFVSEEYYKNLKSVRRAEKGDLLFSVTGSIAIPVLVNIDDPFIFQRHLGILKPNHSLVMSKYLEFALMTNDVKQQSFAVATGTAQQTIPLSGLRSIEIPLPSIEEQAIIVKQIESLFYLVDNLNNRYLDAVSLVEQFTPSLLEKAYRGELVPQDPNDEPASMLLERIQAEREHIAEKPGKIIKTSPRQKVTKEELTMIGLSDTTSTHLSDILKERGKLTAKALWSASQLDIDDFYDQLKSEEAKGLLNEIQSLDQRLLEAV